MSERHARIQAGVLIGDVGFIGTRATWMYVVCWPEEHAWKSGWLAVMTLLTTASGWMGGKEPRNR